MVNFAIIGCGSMAHSHAAQILKIPEIKVVALVDPLVDRTAAFKEKYFHDAAEYASMDELLTGAKKLDAVLLVTPHTLHTPRRRRRLNMGCM